MKNGTRPLYTLLRDPKSIATNGSAKSALQSLRKKILLGAVIAGSLASAAWGFNQYQTMQAKAEYLKYAVAHRFSYTLQQTLNRALLEWGQIQYLKTHAALPARNGQTLEQYNEQFLK